MHKFNLIIVIHKDYSENKCYIGIFHRTLVWRKTGLVMLGCRLTSPVNRPEITKRLKQAHGLLQMLEYANNYSVCCACLIKHALLLKLKCLLNIYWNSLWLGCDLMECLCIKSHPIYTFLLQVQYSYVYVLI